MATTVINDGVLKITLKLPSGDKIGLPEIGPLLTAVSLFKLANPGAEKISLVQDSGDPQIYVYQIELADGRIWHQDLRIIDENDVSQKFDVQDWWGLAEFTPHRECRSQIIELVTLYGLTELEVRWL